MAVYTQVDFHEAARLLGGMHLGMLQELAGIASGIENTNYFATTDRGAFVLTIFERLEAGQLPFYLELMAHLAAAGIPVPMPQPNASGGFVHELHGKPAAVVTRLPGEPVLEPARQHIEQVGAMLARMHLAGEDFPIRQPNLRGRDWCVETAAIVRPHLAEAQVGLLEGELAAQAAAAAQVRALPAGPIHADLFRDNVLFDRGTLSGFFDFYFAGWDSYLFDIAVCLNDWCIDRTTGMLKEPNAAAFLSAYDAVRPRTPGERELLPLLLRAAALRFWLSRLADWHLPRPAALLTPHDPSHFERVLQRRAAGQ